jgi:hypothetical protein
MTTARTGERTADIDDERDGRKRTGCGMTIEFTIPAITPSIFRSID